MDDTIAAGVDRILDSTGRGRADLVPILRAIQNRWHYLPEEALRRVSEASEISPADVDGVASFYGHFRRTPAGRHIIRVCVGTACFVKGADQILSAFRVTLGIAEDTRDTDSDGLFTLERVACLGCCTLAPVVQIDSAIYGNLTRAQVPSILKDFLTRGEPQVGDGEPDPDARARGPDAKGSPRERGRTGAQGRIGVCTCTSCRASGAQELLDAFAREVRRTRTRVKVHRTGCTGLSFSAPVVEIAPASGPVRRLAKVEPAEVPAIVREHFTPEAPVAALRSAAEHLLARMVDLDEEPVRRLSMDLARGPEGAFWGPQNRVVTDPEPTTDPLDLDGYLLNGGFKALGRCLGELSPQDVIEMIRQSGLRGRGGAGFSTAAKWKNVAEAPDGHRHLICNADEGDPGAFMDRMLLESHPYRVIEGMIIAAYAIGCEAGTFFVRSEYPLAIARLQRSIEALASRGFLAKGIMGSSFNFDLEVVESPGAFVCGEETAMIAALEGRRGNPKARPPYPSQQGLWGRPTLVNNVETFATVPWILAHGPAAFRAIGTQGSAGTKTFALAGKINRGGLIEVPMGMSIRRIVDEIGGGVREGRTLKAVQIGGPSGGCVPSSLADLPVDFESLRAAGAMMGSGGLVVLDDTDCMVDVARYFMSFSQNESCGKCTCCRVGTQRMLDILSRLCEGKGRREDLPTLRELASALKDGSLCGLGRSAPNPVLTTLEYFREEYEEHLDGYCRAGRCRALIVYAIGDECIGCTRCAQRCPAKAIAPAPYQKHSIDESLCIRCDTCRQVCPAGAVKIARKARS